MNKSESYVLKTGSGNVSVNSTDLNSEKVLSLFGESLSLSSREVPSKIDNYIVLKSAGKNFDNPRSNNKISFGNRNEISLELDSESTPRLFLRDGTPAKSSNGSIDLLSEEEWMWRQLSKLSAVIGSCFFNNGGFLIHSGLAKFQPQNVNYAYGVLLAGASGAGKSTASGMFQPPWHSLSDDLVLITKDKADDYIAHPFPTWSSVLWKEDQVKFKAVKFNSPVKLGTVIFIDRGPESRLEKVGNGEALCLLTELVKQANEHLISLMDRSNIAEFNKKYFMNLNRFVRKVNSYSHNLKIDNTFWEEIGNIPEFST